MLILPHPEWGEYLQLTVELFQELTEFFGGNWRVVWGGGMCLTGRKAGRHFCNIWILIICDPVFLDMNCVRSTFQLEPVCDQVTTLPAFLQSLPFLLSVMVLNPSGLLLANLYSIGGFSRTIAPPLNRLLHIVHGLLQENVEGVLVRIWHFFFFWEVSKNLNCVLDL